MLNFSFITIHPKFLESYFSFGVFNSAISKKIISPTVINLRDYAIDKHGSIDDAPYGGGDGMVFRPEPLAAAVKNFENTHVVLMSPRGKKWHQSDAVKFSQMDKNIVFVCGRFGGVDQRFIDNYVDEEFSVGDFVLSGGELPSLVIADSILRMIPEVLGNQESAVMDSFAEGYDGLLEHDLYTRPADFEGHKVPDVLLSGNHKKISEWRQEKSKLITERNRPDLLKNGKKGTP